MNVVQTLNNRNNTTITKLYTPYVTCVLHLWQGNVRITYHRSAFMQPLLQWKSKSIMSTHSECVSVALVTQHTKPMATLYFHLWHPLLYHIFFHITSHTAQYSGKKVTEHEMRILIFSAIIVWNIPNSKKYSAKISSEMYIRLHAQCPLFLSDFNETWIFSTDLQKLLKYQMSQKSIQW